MGDFANMTRFYVNRNLTSIFTMWAGQRGTPVQEDDFRRILPLLPTASLVSDQELQQLWGKLLESFCSEEDLVLPSFGQTLAQLTSSEAKFLDAVWQHGRFPQRTDGLRSLYFQCKWNTLNEVVEYEEFPRQPSLLLRLEFDVVLSDLLRLGILERNSTFSEEVDGHLEENIAFSGYGRKFMRAILGQPKNQETA